MSIQESHDEKTSYLDWSREGRSGVGWYAIGVALSFLIFMVLSGIGSFPVTLLDPDFRDSLIESDLALLLAFPIAFVGIPYVVHKVHARPWWSVAMPRLHFDRFGLAVGFILHTVLGVVGVAIAHVVGVIDVDLESVDATLWLELLVIAGVGIFVQAGAEELFFRGYLTQAVRRFTAQPAVFLLIPAMLFAAPHLTNLEQFDGSPYVLLPYLVDGLVFGWVAYRTGSLWMSLGIHWSNNLSNVILVGPRDDVLGSAAPLQFDIPNSIAELTVIAVVTSVVTVVIVEIIIRRTGRGVPAEALAG